jgi:hypothetical protein
MNHNSFRNIKSGNARSRTKHVRISGLSQYTNHHTSPTKESKKAKARKKSNLAKRARKHNRGA